MRTTILIFVLSMLSLALEAQEPEIPVLGLCIAAPERGFVKEFDKFIREELAPLGVNTLVLRVDWNYEYETHPELRDDDPLTRKDVKTLVETCQDLNINLIPQINLLGHQSWANHPGKLLEAYPQFDETPWVQILSGRLLMSLKQLHSMPAWMRFFTSVTASALAVQEETRLSFSQAKST
jgi:hypothetical protein